MENKGFPLITREEAAALTGMDLTEYDRICSVNDIWPFPAETDGWAYAHSCIRADLKDLSAILKALVQRASEGSWLTPLERSSLLSFWRMLSRFIHDHHEHEEEFVFPALEKRFTVPEDGYVVAHQTLMEGMDMVGGLVQQLCALEAANEKLLNKLLAVFEPWRAAIEQHLAHEERVSLPLTRKHFTPKEVTKITDQFIKKMPISEHAHFFGRMSDDQRKAFFKQEGIPGFAQALFIMPATRKWQRKYEVPMKQLIAGEQLSAPKKCWLCFAA